MKAMLNDVPLTMICEDLDSTPQCPLPAPYSFRWFRPGDERVWQDIQANADLYNDITDDLFSTQFGPDFDRLRERQVFLLDATQRAIATATAWFDEDFYGQLYGRVHWVAVLPGMQGLGLAKPLMSIICNRLNGLGHKRAYLTTSTARVPAINLYLKFGFVPQITGSHVLGLWDEISKEIGRYNEGKDRLVLK